MFYLISENFSWMTFNILLAIIPVFLAWLFYMVRTTFTKIILLIAWLLFVPNTIYIFTDILHFMIQINEVNLFGAIILLAQYAILFICGFLTYILSLYPIEKALAKKYKKKERKNATYLIIGINFLIGFGIVLGRIHRLNSWDIIVEIENVFITAIQTVGSPKMISLAILFGLFGNFIYFLFKRKTVKYISQVFSNLRI